MKAPARFFLALLWMAVIGLSPIWISIVRVYLDSRSPSAGSDYWAVAPWMVLIAAFYTWISFGVAAITLIAFLITPGTTARKFGAGCLAFVVLLAIVWTGFAWRSHQRQLTARADESLKQTGADYVQRHPLVVSRLGVNPQASIWMSSDVRDYGVTVDYVYSIHSAGNPTTPEVAILAVTRRPDGPQFKLRCVMTLYAFQNREAQSDPCHPVFAQGHEPPATDAVAFPVPAE